ncbi:hypothetical protein [Alteromonas sp. a30]|uniref:hypothetical protein n=1 Tax=Alteromonas sp. a30 TaxID=2730917 RepID=UPI00228305E8|nr:hypothetical protein [Alteromonas sp. a30]MCY7295073.1 hypothetical protein [Alteromonas sp. a30]
MNECHAVRQRILDIAVKLEQSGDPQLVPDDLFDMCTDAIADLELALEKLNALDA